MAMAGSTGKNGESGDCLWENLGKRMDFMGLFMGKSMENGGEMGIV